MYSKTEQVRILFNGIYSGTLQWYTESLLSEFLVHMFSLTRPLL